MEELYGDRGSLGGRDRGVSRCWGGEGKKAEREKVRRLWHYWQS